MSTTSRRESQQALGDWQTPLDLARDVVDVVSKLVPHPAAVLEPTCGRGSFLVAASARLPRAKLVGYDIDPTHVAEARRALAETTRERGRVRLAVADFFSLDWRRELAKLPDPLLVLGNPPWVTSATLGALGSKNLPVKSAGAVPLSGFEALTGKSNFDISEWMLLRLLESLGERGATVAVLCKSKVARRVVELASRGSSCVAPGGLWRIDARRHFGAAVDAVLFVCRTGQRASAEGRAWPVYPSLDASLPSSLMALVDGRLVPDLARFRRTAHLAGDASPEWRSGLKHDCSAVMELARPRARAGARARGWVNGLGEPVAIESTVAFPLVKSSDLANGPARERAVVVPQRALGEDTGALRESAPRAWAYLDAHRGLLEARKSAIYRDRPPFSIFGIGPYAFAPWKVAISGLHKRVALALLGPRRGLPVMLDDTCYFLPFADEDGARCALEALRSPLAEDFLAARIFWDAKRPIQKSVLQRLDLGALRAALGESEARGKEDP